MLRLISDEDVHDDIIRGVRRREPEIDIVRAFDVGLDHTPDPMILGGVALLEGGERKQRAGPCRCLTTAAVRSASA